MIDLLGESVGYFGRLHPFGLYAHPYQPQRSTTEHYGTSEPGGYGRRIRNSDSTVWRDIPIEIEGQAANKSDTSSATSESLVQLQEHPSSVEEFPGSNDVICLSDPWVSGLFLTQKDREELEGDSQLSDKHIFAAQKLLQKQFPRTKGLQDSCLSQTTFQPVDLHSPDGAVVQIHHTRGNHWVVSAFVDGQVLVYDSLYKNLSPDLVKQLKEIYKDHPQQDEDSIFKVIMPEVMPQKGGTDCGTYVVAYAYELCCGRDPTELHFDQKQMRKHLTLCFSSEELSRFPIVTFLKRDKTKDNEVYV